MKRRIFLCFFLLSASYFYAVEENIVVKTSNGDIYGTLLLPDSAQNIPIALLIAGSGPTDRNGNQPTMQTNTLKYLAEGLEQNGIASLRFDKRAIGESKDAGLKEEDLRFETYVNDVKLWIDLLAKDTRFQSITIIGHSEGSLIGMLAAMENPHVSTFVSLAGVALPADEVIMEQLKNQPATVLELITPIFAQLKKGQTVTDVPTTLFSLFRPSVQPYMISWIKYSPKEEIKKLNIPILIIQGTTDIQVPTIHADWLAEANPKAGKKIIESMNHVLKKCESTEQLPQIAVYTNPALPLVDELLPAIVQFIR
ncbi:MAG: alpha/beta hydrolase [Candidatus Symbiothrix sp.]|jgi:pimeloyl-ACP methyl ester carboxylesterase|nr:alpha/beta hydrolase [Candidatus Symbiothrix sp.]